MFKSNWMVWHQMYLMSSEDRDNLRHELFAVKVELIHRDLEIKGLHARIEGLNVLVEQLQGKGAFKCGKEEGLRLALSILWGGAEKQACIDLIVDYLNGAATK